MGYDACLIREDVRLNNTEQVGCCLTNDRLLYLPKI